MEKGKPEVPIVKLNMSRQEQVVIGNKMKELIICKLGSKFSVKYQGSPKGKVAIMVIVGSNVSYMKEVKSYLWGHFRTGQDKINGHGSIETTVVIQLSELTQISRTMIEVEYNKIFSEKIKKNSLIPIVKMRDVAEVPIVKRDDDTKEKIEHGRMSVSQTLSSVFAFERNLLNPASVGNIVLKNFFTYDKKMENEFTVLNSISEEIAIMIEKSLVWFTGDEKSVFRLDDKILIDLSILKNKKERRAGVLFCLPPSCSASHGEVVSRLRRVCKGTIPIVKRTTEDSFKVNYIKKGSALKILGLIKEMGWLVELIDDKELTVYLKKSLVVNPESNEVSVPLIDTTLVETEEIISEEKVVSELSVVETAKQNTLPKFIPPVSSREDALIELEKLYSNQEIFSVLSVEVQKEVTSILKESWIERHVEDYVKDLLTFFKK